MTGLPIVVHDKNNNVANVISPESAEKRLPADFLFIPSLRANAQRANA
jgi:hypothetical protein